MNEDLERLRQRSITKLNSEAALTHIGTLIDLSQDAAYARGADRACNLLDELARRELTGREQVIVEYFRANAWTAKEHASGAHRSSLQQSRAASNSAGEQDRIAGPGPE